MGAVDRLQSARAPLPGAAARRTSFDALARDYTETVLAEFDEKERSTRTRQLKWWPEQFAGFAVAEITADSTLRARDRLAVEAFGRSGATVNHYIACLSHALSFAVKERRLLDRNPVSDISRKKEPRGRTQFLTDDKRAVLLDACAKSAWAGPAHARSARDHDRRQKRRADSAGGRSQSQSHREDDRGQGFVSSLGVFRRTAG